MNSPKERLPLLIMILALTSACTTTPHSTDDATTDYLESLQRLEVDGAPFPPESEQERAAIQEFQELLSDFKAQHFRARIKDVYADNVFFNDTLTTIKTADALEEYLAASAEQLETGTVEFLDVVSTDGNYYFRWRMGLRFKSLAKGRETTTVGMSHIRFDADGKVVLHQDFWDSSTGFFEHIPALGWMIRQVKRRL